MTLKQIEDTFVSAVKAALASHKHIVILPHKNPDGDAMGSGLALCNYLREQGKEAYFILPNAMPDYLSWMPGADQLVVYETQKEQAEQILSQTELVFMVDFNHSSRLSALNNVVAPLKVPKIMIDHHPEPEDIAQHVYSRVSASSTCEMVYELLAELEGENVLSVAVATCLMVGLITDTGKFSHNSSNPATYLAVAGLLQAGIDKDFIIDKIYNNHSEDRMRLLGYVLKDKMTILPEYGAAYIALSIEEQQRYNFKQGDTEGFVNYPLGIQGINFSAFFMEKEKIVKCSFRSQGDFPANLVAKEHFGGGGHLNAAGGESNISLEQSVEKFIKILPEYKAYFDAAKEEL